MEKPNYLPPDRNLALELVRVTETAAMAASKWVGRGEKEKGDGAAVDGMRHMISSVSMQGIVVIGEGEKDHAPMLYNGEIVGNGDGPLCDVAVDPVDGTTQMAKGMTNALSVIAVSERNSMYDPSAVFYMDKLVVGPESKGLVDINAPISDTIKIVAKAREKTVSEVTVCVLDRPRHTDLIKNIRDTGAKVRLLSDGDVAGAIAVSSNSSTIDMLAGIGGTPEGIIAAAAMACIGGEIQGILHPTNDDEIEKAKASGYNLGEVLTTKQLCSGENVFVALTGVTDGDLLKGVAFRDGETITDSIVMRSKSGTVRRIISGNIVQNDNNRFRRTI